MKVSSRICRSSACSAPHTRTALGEPAVQPAFRNHRCQAQGEPRPTSASNGDGGKGPLTPQTYSTDNEDSDPHVRQHGSRALVYTVLAAALLVVTQLRDRRRYHQWVTKHSTVLGSTQHGSKASADASTPAVAVTTSAIAHSATALVIPVLNEEGALPALFEHLNTLRPAPAEVIFVDGGSTDRTREMIRRQPGMRLVCGRRGRARQMNAGAAAAASAYLCFVHADTRPCADLVNVVRYELTSDGTVAGGFVTRITHAGRPLPWQTTHHFLKTFYMPLLMRPLGFALGLRCVLGDQNIFVRRADFEAAGGFDEALPIMEDADLTLRLHRSGTTLRPGKRARVRHVMYRGNETSGRRMVEWGGLKATALHFRIGLMWLFGCSPQELQHVYDTMYTDTIRTPAAGGA